MGQIIDAFKGAFQTRDIPKTIRGRFNTLMRREKGNTARVAERLGVTRRAVQRYVKGERKIDNNPKVAEKLEREVMKDHQPRVRARALQQARDRGLQVETLASFGFSAADKSTDDARLRRLTEDIPDRLVDDLFDAMSNGDEDRMQELIAEGLAEEYFRTPGTEAASLEVEFTGIQYIEVDYQ